ncbi:hypothetical protein ACFVYF_24390 [Streptomyces sp. NPDC058274]|jgi:fermentation-respiration switch protein FrsA (DUF1100 family)|uniref:hypothetical protein n=1 Tax=Streptomyces sp. NPDC058274 TaxID=3346416 RepID=UPI0029CCAA7B|nr:uncharacterized protein [Streptomyces sp.]
MIVGSEAVTAHMTTEAFGKAREPKELRTIEGATHVDLYDRDPYVTLAVAGLTAFFRSHLHGQRSSQDPESA